MTSGPEILPYCTLQFVERASYMDLARSAIWDRSV